MSLPLLHYDKLHDAPLNDSKLWLEPFRYNGADYCGIQPSAWESSEAAWDSGDPVYLPPNNVPSRDVGRGFGKWVGPGSVHVRPGSLNVAALDVSTLALERVGHDDLARVSDAPEGGALLRASWTRLDVGVGLSFGGQVHLVVQEAETGAILDEQIIEHTIIQADLPALTAHAVLWARYEAVNRSWSLPPDYLSVRGFTAVPDKFKYTEDSIQYVWDYEADVGRRPTDPNHPFYALEHEAFLAGELVHRGPWTQYISDGGSYGGPWSALRIAVGETDFSVGANFQPYPGPVLYELEDEATRAAVLIDPLALSVSASYVLDQGGNAGKCRIAGTIASRSGPLTSYWDFHPDAPIDNLAATLLGVNDKTTVLACEASLYPQVSDILEIQAVAPETRSTELVLTRAFLHQYDPDASDITDRLPGLPRVTLGHPGGRCLRFSENKIRFFTESFGNVGTNRGTDKFAQFYNALREVDLKQQTRSGNGTLFHGDNCAELCWNSLYGWAQDKPFGEDAKQYLAVMKSGVWDDSGLAPFPADSYLWQRLRALGTENGTHLLASGKRPSSEEPIWGLSDGQHFRDAWLPFRPRRLTRVTDEIGQEWVYAVGRFVSKANDGLYDIAAQWSVIRLSGLFVTIRATWNSDAGTDGGFCMDKAEALEKGIDPANLPLYLRWIVDTTQPPGGYWLPSQTQPDEPYLELNVGSTTICYLLHGTLPYDPTLWPYLDFTVYDDGGIGSDAIPPVPGCQHAQCVIDVLDDLGSPATPGAGDVVFSWNPDAGEDGGYCTDKAAAIALGLNPDLLPPYLAWVTDAAYGAPNGPGGYWTPADVEPAEPYLELNVGSTTICYLLHGTLPYDPLLWDTIVFPVGEDGGIGDGPFVPSRSQIYYLVQPKDVSGEQGASPWTQIQVSDVSSIDPHSRLRWLRRINVALPNLWMRIDSEAAQDDLSTYTIRVPWNEPFSLPTEAKEKIEVVALFVASIGAQPVFETVRVN